MAFVLGARSKTKNPRRPAAAGPQEIRSPPGQGDRLLRGERTALGVCFRRKTPSPRVLPRAARRTPLKYGREKFWNFESVLVKRLKDCVLTH